MDRISSFYCDCNEDERFIAKSKTFCFEKILEEGYWLETNDIRSYSYGY